MGAWFRLDLGNGQDAYEPTTRLQHAFIAALMGDSTTTDVALFSRYDLEADNVQIFFTPGASKIAAAFGAYPCDKPAPSRFRIALLAGHDDALSRHFPDQKPA